MTIRLVAVDEHVLLRLGLNRVVATVPDIFLVGEASSAAEAERVVAETAAPVVTIDASLVTKAAPISSVLAAIRHAAVAPHSFTAPGLPSALSRRRGQAGLLSQREQEVLMLMRDGLSLPTIAQRLTVSEATVKTYVSRLYSKLRVNNRSQALMAAVNQGLLLSADAA
ncbi:response regulator transcription factor [Dactylosporangium sp. McL0621]|uniref:response regulator transcription factor n=1 Tax=Dactylosporangium sp. McL0621 TaxID=3415678 RepID=UPI003CEE29BE